MNESKRKKLEAAGWKFGSADEFLGLGTDGDMLPGTGCHPFEAIRPQTKPATWRTLYIGCGICQGRMILATSRGVHFYLCLQCDVP